MRNYECTIFVLITSHYLSIPSSISITLLINAFNLARGRPISVFIPTVRVKIESVLGHIFSSNLIFAIVKTISLGMMSSPFLEYGFPLTINMTISSREP